MSLLQRLGAFGGKEPRGGTFSSVGTLVPKSSPLDPPLRSKLLPVLHQACSAYLRPATSCQMTLNAGSMNSPSTVTSFPLDDVSCWASSCAAKNTSDLHLTRLQEGVGVCRHFVVLRNSSVDQGGRRIRDSVSPRFSKTRPSLRQPKNHICISCVINV